MFYPRTEGSQELANMLQKAFITSLNPGSNRKTKPAEGIYLMKHIQKTGVLIECGFISNQQEEFRLRQPEYQKKLCCVIVSVCGEFINRDKLT